MTIKELKSQLNNLNNHDIVDFFNHRVEEAEYQTEKEFFELTNKLIEIIDLLDIYYKKSNTDFDNDELIYIINCNLQPLTLSVIDEFFLIKKDSNNNLFIDIFRQSPSTVVDLEKHYAKIRKDINNKFTLFIVNGTDRKYLRNLFLSRKNIIEGAYLTTIESIELILTGIKTYKKGEL